MPYLAANFLIATIAFFHADGPVIQNVTVTYGQLGPVRQDLRFLPGDVLHFQFDIVGLKNDEMGRVRYILSLELVGPQNKTIARQRLPEVTQVRVFGNRAIRQALHVALPEDLRPGDYLLDLSVEDSTQRNTPASKQTLPFKVVPLDFGIVQFQLYSIYTPQIQLPCPGVGVVGQNIYVTFMVLRGKKTKPDENWNLDVELRVLDAQGKPLTDSFPVRGQFRKVPGELDFLDIRFDLPVQKAGDFFLSIQATEPGTARSAKLLVPFTAVDLHQQTRPTK